MERIQQAIAKARAARQVREVAEAVQPAANDRGLDAVWSSLTEVQLNPGKLEAGRIVAHQPGPGVTAFDLMRTNLLKHLREHGWSRVAITSPSSGCGKTTVCLNLAFSLARQAELRVVVLEMDLRRPAIVRTLGLTGKPCLADVLSGKETPEKGLLRIGKNLAIGANAEPAANPAELLSSAQAAATIDAIQARLKPDVILFDLPPVLVIDDTLAFLDQVDCALMIAAAEESTVAEIDRAGRELADYTKVLGVVLNKCRFLDRAEGYGYDEY
ncbi:MAG: CpsD/CapB family tyrosine-protein kinase [Paracoccaceae bacterium]|nr:CpsD/CapB family tyrosine-protein kinase [Paracoccaceae bacterium]